MPQGRFRRRDMKLMMALGKMIEEAERSQSIAVWQVVR